MTNHGSRSTRGPGPSRSGLWAQKYDLPPLKWSFPTTFVFIKVLPRLTVKAVDALQTLFRAPLTLGVWVQGQNHAKNLFTVQCQLFNYHLIDIPFDRMGQLIDSTMNGHLIES
jgi:hypothetical protein